MPESAGTAERQQPVEAEAEGCQVQMYRGLCGRPLHPAPPGADRVPVCLMHSCDQNKDNGAFQREFEWILAAAGEREADFTRFVFLVADYRGREFKARCTFYGARFTRWTDFVRAMFAQEATFVRATFNHEAHFNGAAFIGEADFTGARFTQEANFYRATFSTDAWFRETKFRNDGQGIGPIFSRARFEKPERVEFYQTNRGRHCSTTATFRGGVFSNVKWRERKNGKRMVFEEVVSLEHEAAEALKPAAGSADDLNYGLIAELYQQLKKNFDDRRDYWTAEDFHYGEMEMKRLASGHHRVLRRGGLLERWFGRVLGSGRSMTVAARILSRLGLGLGEYISHHGDT